MSNTVIYLDHAAATPLDPRVLAAMRPYFSDDFYNPSATYQAARDTRKSLEAARADVAHWLGARPSEVIFTAGGTEANNLALFGVARNFPNSHFVSTQIEHDSILQPLTQLEQDGWQQTLVQPKPNGIVDPEAIAAAISDQTVLVSVGYANNEIGTVQPLRRIAEIISKARDDRRTRGIKRPLYFHTDACQASNYLDLHAARLGVDLMTINGGKIYGPKQSGALFVKAGIALTPLIFGGGQEQGKRSGTENVPAAVGFAKALELAQTVRHDETRRLQQLQEVSINLIEQNLPTATINGSTKQRLPNNIHLTIAGVDNERLLIQLDEAGVQAAAGSACSASDEEPSHVLRAIGLSDDEARASLRLTMGRSTDQTAMERAIDLLQQFTHAG
jgi:cysteine desulfurase